MYGGEGTIVFFKNRTLDDEQGGVGWLVEGEGWGWGWGMGDGRWEMGSGSVRCGCQMCSTHEIKVEHTSKLMSVPFSTCMLVRALSVFFKQTESR